MSVYNGEEGIDMSSWFFCLNLLRGEDKEIRSKVGDKNE